MSRSSESERESVGGQCASGCGRVRGAHNCHSPGSDGSYCRSSPSRSYRFGRGYKTSRRFDSWVTVNFGGHHCCCATTDTEGRERDENAINTMTNLLFPRFRSLFASIISIYFGFDNGRPRVLPQTRCCSLGSRAQSF